MIKLIATAALFACMLQVGLAQNRASIQGKLVDSASNEAVDFATVALVNPIDSSLISYTLTAKGGLFALHNLPVDKDLKLVISFIAYNNFRKILHLQKGQALNLGIIKLSSKVNALNEVKITAEGSPVVVRKDTIEFNAESFKTPPNAVVEELLRRLPGIEVDMNGNISINGKRVQKLVVNGKRYFANDPRIASKNLDVELVDKVQVYDDREDDPDHLIPDAEVNKIINLKLKSAIKKSVGGKLHGGMGTRNRFDAGLLYNMFRDTLQVSLIGIGNNLNRSGFTNGDLTSIGGFNRSGTDALYNGSIATGGRAYGGIETIGSGGVNINTDYGKKLKINLLYFYSHTTDVYNVITSGQQVLTGTVLSSNSTLNQHNNNDKHNISGLVEWNPDTAVKIRYQPAVSFNGTNNTSSSTRSSFSDLVPQLNSSVNTDHNRTNTFQFQQSFSYYRKFHDGASVNISHSLNISPSSGMDYTDYNFISYTTELQSSDLPRLADNSSHGASTGLSITYRYPFSKKLIGDVSVNGGYNRSHGRLFTYDQNHDTGLYDIYIDSLSRNLIRTQLTETVRPELTFMITKTARLIANLGIQFTQVYNRFNKAVPDINRYETYLLPSLSFSNARFSANYNVNVRQPSINDMLPYSTFYSQLYSRRGNPDLKPTRTHSLYMSYYVNKTESMLNYNLYSNFSVDENNIFNETTQTDQGATFAKPVNRTGSYSGYIGFSIGKTFKKSNNWQIRSSTSLTNRLAHSFLSVNFNDGVQNDVNLSANEQVFVSWNNKVDLNPSYNVNPTITTYKNVDYKSLKYTIQSFDLPATIKWIKHMTIEADYSYTYNPQIGEGFQRSANILNLSVARQFQFRDRGEIKISCYDLFDQSISVYRYASGNVSGTQQNQILRRYFLLSYAYRFTSTTTKK